MYETVLLKKDGGVATVALNRPKVLNVFNMQLHKEIYDALNDAVVDQETQCIVLRGEGKGSSVLADLAEVVEGEDNSDGPDLGEYLRNTYSRLITRIVGMEKPIVAALDAQEAYRVGLVNKVVPDENLEEEAAALAGRLAGLPTQALGRTKQTLHKSFESDLAAALEAEAVGQTFCGYTQHHKEGIAAFFEKRDPTFTGR